MEQQIYDVIVTAIPSQLAEIYVEKGFSGKTVKAWDWGCDEMKGYGLVAKVEEVYRGDDLHYFIPIKYLKRL